MSSNSAELDGSIEVITLGDNMQPPVVNSSTAIDVYDCVRTDDFEVGVFNGMLMAIVTYLDHHGVDYNDGGLPWAESSGVEN